MKKNRILWLTQLALLTALVLLLQMLPLTIGQLQLAAFALIPIVVGGALLGAGAGAWLGLVFGLVVLFGPDTLAYFMPFSPLGTVVTILARGVLAGAAGGLVYKALQRKTRFGAMICAAIAVPVVNTGIFVLGSRVFFWPLLTQWADGDTVAFLFLTMIGVNFFIELAATVVLSTALLPVMTRLKRAR